MGLIRGGKAPRPECDLATKSDLEKKIDRLTTKAAEREMNDNVPIGQLKSTRISLVDTMNSYISKCGPLSIQGRKYGRSDPQTIDGLIRDKRRSMEVPEEEL